MTNYEATLAALKKKKHKTNKKITKNKKISFINKILFLVVILLTVSVYFKVYPNQRAGFNNLINRSFSFATVRHNLENFFDFVPFRSITDNHTVPVFGETLVYKDSESYQDGIRLTVEENYLVPALESGIVVFMGNQGDFENIIIIQQANGIDTWYINVTNASVRIYDYVEKGRFLGNTKNEFLYLMFKKDGAALDPKDHI